MKQSLVTKLFIVLLIAVVVNSQDWQEWKTFWAKNKTGIYYYSLNAQDKLYIEASYPDTVIGV